MATNDCQEFLEDLKHHTYHYAREKYDVLVTFLRSQHDIRIQAEFLNFATKDWGLRLYYPELPIIMYDSFKKLSFMMFDDLSSEEKERIVTFFSSQESLNTVKSVTDEQVRSVREFHRKFNVVPTM
jgi:hypothetical protein